MQITYRIDYFPYTIFPNIKKGYLEKYNPIIAINGVSVLSEKARISFIHNVQ